MTFFTTVIARYHQFIGVLQHADGIPALALRWFLVPIFWMAGSNKLANFSDTVAWFGNPEWGLGLPFPSLMASLATGAELGGAILLALGLMTRLISIPLIVTMLVAIFTVHLPNGWQAIADPSAPFANMQVMDSAEKLARANEILMQHGNYDWLTSSGNLVILKQRCGICCDLYGDVTGTHGFGWRTLCVSRLLYTLLVSKIHEKQKPDIRAFGLSTEHLNTRR